MDDFYRRLLAGLGCSVALCEAQFETKDRYPDPFYWGAFICQEIPNRSRLLSLEHEPPTDPSPRAILHLAPLSSSQGKPWRIDVDPFFLMPCRLSCRFTLTDSYRYSGLSV